MTTFMARLFNTDNRKHQQNLVEVQMTDAKIKLKEAADRLNSVIADTLDTNDRLRINSRGVNTQ